MIVAILIFYILILVEKIVQIERKIKNSAAITLALFCFAIISFSCAPDGYNIFDCENGEFYFWSLLIFTPVLFFYGFMPILRKEHLAELRINYGEIKMIYKIDNKTTRTEIIQKNNIKLFKFDAFMKVLTGRYGVEFPFLLKYKIIIELFEGEKIIVENYAYSGYKFLYQFLDVSSFIPNFEFDFSSNGEVIETEIDYYKHYGSHLSSWDKFKLLPFELRAYFILVPIIIFLVSLYVSLT